ATTGIVLVTWVISQVRQYGCLCITAPVDADPDPDRGRPRHLPRDPSGAGQPGGPDSLGEREPGGGGEPAAATRAERPAARPVRPLVRRRATRGLRALAADERAGAHRDHIAHREHGATGAGRAVRLGRARRTARAARR